MSQLPVLPGFAVARMVPADAAGWAEFALRPEMARFTSVAAASVDDLLPMIERNLSPDPAAPVLFAVRDSATGEFAAACGFHTISPLNRTAEVTYSVRPERWGRGLATALCQALADWGFAERGWVRIQATTLVDHLASQRVLQKCGFTLEGRVRNFRLVRGEPRDYLMFSRVPSG
jgi:[ribosomal protein S5]-alanine N-acetyltransferase